MSALLWCVNEEEDYRQGTQVPQLQGLLVQLGKLNFAELGCFQVLHTCRICQAHPAGA